MHKCLCIYFTLMIRNYFQLNGQLHKHINKQITYFCCKFHMVSCYYLHNIFLFKFHLLFQQICNKRPKRLRYFQYDIVKPLVQLHSKLPRLISDDRQGSMANDEKSINCYKSHSLAHSKHMSAFEGLCTILPVLRLIRLILLKYLRDPLKLSHLT